MAVQFGRPTGLFWCFDSIFDQNHLSTIQKMVYIAFCRHANSKGESFPTYQTIAKECSCSRYGAIKATNKLIECGLVVKHRRKRQNGSDTSNLYIVFPPHQPFDPEKEQINLKGQVENKESTKLTGGADELDSRRVNKLDPHKETHVKEHVVVGEPLVNRISVPDKSDSLRKEKKKLISKRLSVNESLLTFNDLLDKRALDEVKKAVEAVVNYNKNNDIENIIGVILKAIQDRWPMKNVARKAQQQCHKKPVKKPVKKQNRSEKELNLIRQLYMV